MIRTALADLVERQVTASLVTTVGRTIDRVAEELAADLLRDPAFRTQMQDLIRVAFRRALESLTAEVTPPA
jgi:uncharacterized membrane-anchored protein YjiN (DUF445 family)